MTLEAGDRAHGELGYTCGRAARGLRPRGCRRGGWSPPSRASSNPTTRVPTSAPTCSSSARRRRPTLIADRTPHGSPASRQRRHRHRIEPRARSRQRHGARRGRRAVVVCGRDAARLEAARAQSRRRPGAAGADRVLAVPIDLSTRGRPGDARRAGRRRASAASTSWSTTSAWPRAPGWSTRPTRRGRRRSTTRCIRPCARRARRCRT